MMKPSDRPIASPLLGTCRRVLPALALGIFAVACATGSFERDSQAPVSSTEKLADGEDTSILQGIVRIRDSHQKADGALVVLACPCLETYRETRTNADGIYRFRDLPPGEYTVQVLYGRVDVSTRITMAAGYRVRTDFKVDPEATYTVT